MSVPNFTAGGEDFVVIPAKEYKYLQGLAEQAEDAADVAVAVEWQAAKTRGEALALPRAQWARMRAHCAPASRRCG